MTRTGFVCFALAALTLSLVGCDSGRLAAPTEPGFGPPVLATTRVPSNTNAAAVSDSRIDVSWQPNGGNGTGFEVHRSTTGANGAFTLLVSIDATTTNYSDNGLSSATQYCYKVRAVRTSGATTQYSAFSNTACATTATPPPPPPPPPPAAPVGPSATPINSTAVSLTWTDNSNDEDGFRVERSVNGTGLWELAGTTGPNATAFTDGGRSSEQQVCYQVIAFNGGGDSGPSDADCTTPPAGPSDLTAIAVDSQTVDLAWIDNSGVEDGYQLTVSYTWASCVTGPEGGACDAGIYENDYLVDLPPNSTSASIGVSLGSGSSILGYRFVVVARADGGRSDFSNQVSVP